jgi:hypothetical protein
MSVEKEPSGTLSVPGGAKTVAGGVPTAGTVGGPAGGFAADGMNMFGLPAAAGGTMPAAVGAAIPPDPV